MRCFALVIAVLIPSFAHSQDAELVAAGKKAKAATVLVVGEKSTGTAFCIDAAGKFITNEHVVKLAKTVQIVSDPGLPKQKVWTAAVVRTSRYSDLAMLEVKGRADWPTLSLGSLDGVDDQEAVVVVGFPGGFDLSLSTDNIPSPVVNSGKVTSIQKSKAGVAEEITFDASTGKGGSGSALVNKKGVVLGVFNQFLVRAEGVKCAIPVSKLKEFIERPEIKDPTTDPKIDPILAPKPKLPGAPVGTAGPTYTVPSISVKALVITPKKAGAQLDIDGKLVDAKPGSTIAAGGVTLRVIDVQASGVKIEVVELKQTLDFQ